jgi:hypothetical protein
MERAGVFYVVVGARGKMRGEYSVQIPAFLNMTPGKAIAIGVLMTLGAGFAVFLGYAFQ